MNRIIRLFPGLKNPMQAVSFVILRLIVNIGLTALTVRITGWSDFSYLAILLTMVSGVIPIIVLRRTVSAGFSLIDYLTQIGLVVTVAVVVFLYPSPLRILLAVIGSVIAFVGLLISIPWYGAVEAP